MRPDFSRKSRRERRRGAEWFMAEGICVGRHPECAAAEGKPERADLREKRLRWRARLHPCHCEPDAVGRGNPARIQMDCFVAYAPRNDNPEFKWHINRFSPRADCSSL